MENISNVQSQDVVVQKYLGNKGLIIFLALLSAFVPLSTDLYLPALPTMTQYFNTQVYQTNLTLILFFVFYSLATLVWGPLSDKYGRRPILISGLVVYTVASILCAAAVDINQLILFRVLQAIGGGVASALATAIVKDVYQGKKRESTLAIVQSMVVISPAAAPVIGALLLTFTSWRGIFVAEAVLGLAVVILSAVFSETVQVKTMGHVLSAIGRLRIVLKNPAFTVLLFIFSMMSIIMLAFISSSSYIYQQTFGLDSQAYSYFFTFNAVGMLIGPFVYMKLSARLKRFLTIKICFIIVILSGMVICVFGHLGPWVFALSLIPSTIAGSCTRPGGTFLMLEQQKGDSGSASSLMSSFATIMGSIGMIISSLWNRDLVLAVGALNVIFGLVCLCMWVFLTRMDFLKKIREM